MGLGTLKAALTRPAEALGCAPVSLHLRHFVYSSFLALLRTTTWLPLQAGIGVHSLSLV